MVFIFFSNIAGYLPTHGSEASIILGEVAKKENDHYPRIYAYRGKYKLGEGHPHEEYCSRNRRSFKEQ